MSATLAAVTHEQTVQPRRPKAVPWYRTPLEPGLMKQLQTRSDAKGLMQSLGYLGVVAATGSGAFYAAGHAPWWAALAAIFLHGTCYAFMLNAVHELGHGTVFKTKALNALFVRTFAFLGWVNFESFEVSHARHHRYTLHPPDDLEVVLPIRIVVKHFFKQGFVVPLGLWWAVKDSLRLARGRFQGEWEMTLFPEGDPQRRRPVIRWARTLLIGHALIVVVSLSLKLWMIPVLVTLAPFYGGWLFFLCNNTQHIGLQDNVADFRLCCRTFTVNPVVQFLYWHMNYHTEHHMYAAVPCYNLGRLHRAIRHDLPPCPAGIAATWREIARIQKIQEANPGYQHMAMLPAAQEGCKAA